MGYELMIDDEDLKDLPSHVRLAIKAALRAAEEDRDPKVDREELMQLGFMLMGGAVPTPAVIIAAVGASVSLLRWGVAKHKRRINKSRAAGISAGLAARASSKATSARAMSRGAGRARRGARR